MRTLTLAQYRAMEEEGEITRPLTWGPIELRASTVTRQKEKAQGNLWEQLTGDAD